MNGVSLGDVFLILVVCAIIYGILALVNRGRSPSSKEKDPEGK